MSCDTALGVPFNIVQYSLLTHLVAQVVNMVPEEFVWVGGDTHIYLNQMEGIEQQMNRTPNVDNVPYVTLNKEIKSIFDFKFEDITVHGYDNCQPAIKFPGAAV